MATNVTARGIKAMLTRAGVNYSALTITDDSAVWTNLETGRSTTSVKIEGPKDIRSKVWDALEDRGLVCAPYPEYDMWSRRTS
jgi:hypothetical protein